MLMWCGFDFDASPQVVCELSGNVPPAPEIPACKSLRKSVPFLPSVSLLLQERWTSFFSAYLTIVVRQFVTFPLLVHYAILVRTILL